ncbi:MAG: hypothetical protein DRI61_08780 [Chloroflexi bacterium]|nr:MAG: hypothetical protein DRI61_08780 [Chloroflexota bacterium]
MEDVEVMKIMMIMTIMTMKMMTIEETLNVVIITNIVLLGDVCVKKVGKVIVVMSVIHVEFVQTIVTDMVFVEEKKVENGVTVYLVGVVFVVM